MIYDCFPFFNELEILDIRFNTLYDVVDKFVIAESNVTFSGKSKPLYFKDNEKRYRAFQDKIIYVLINDMPIGEGLHWEREICQKDGCVKKGVIEANPEDWLIISDVDEIPRPEIIKSVIKNEISPVSLNMKMYYYFINLISTSKWDYAKMIRKSDFDKLNCGFFHFRNWITTNIIMNNAGWHFTYQGTLDDMIYKIEALATQQINTDEIKNKIFPQIVKEQKNMFIKGHDKLFPVKIDESFPVYVQNKIQYYKDKKMVFKQSVTIIGMIYKDSEYLDFMMDGITRYGYADGYDVGYSIIANDATESIMNKIRNQNINHIEYHDANPNDYYLNRVYRAWNYGAVKAKGDIVVFINSDMAFSHGWLDNLLRQLKPNTIPCSRLVESGKLGSGQHAVVQNFGRSPKEYNENDFLKFVNEIKKEETHDMGLYMPCAIYKNDFIASGGYPEGNIYEGGIGQYKTKYKISGDDYFFHYNHFMKQKKHCTVFDSIVYHIQEGEKDS